LLKSLFGLTADAVMPACSLPGIGHHQGIIIHKEEQHRMFPSNLLPLLTSSTTQISALGSLHDIQSRYITEFHFKSKLF